MCTAQLITSPTSGGCTVFTVCLFVRLQELKSLCIDLNEIWEIGWLRTRNELVKILEVIWNMFCVSCILVDNTPRFEMRQNFKWGRFFHFRFRPPGIAMPNALCFAHVTFFLSVPLETYYPRMYWPDLHFRIGTYMGVLDQSALFSIAQGTLLW